jgi:hypothetical protein
MKYPIWLALLFAILAGSATAQTFPSGDITVGYSPLDILKGYTIFMNGARGSAAFNVNHWFSVVGDVGGYQSHVPESITGETYLFGPRVSLRRQPWMTPFVQALFGGSHFSEYTGGITGVGQQFAFLVGGGGDLSFTRQSRFAIRLEGDFVGIRSSGSTTPAARLSVGIVYRIGGTR